MRLSPVGFAVIVLVALSAPGCSTGDSAASTANWVCCAVGSADPACLCYQEGPNSTGLCSNEVTTCGDVDGGVGCCMSSGDECQCSAPGEACPTMNGVTAAQVAHCPP